MWHVTAEQMRLIEWARTYNWAVQFPDYRTPNDFREWFPATDVTYTIFNVDSYTSPAGMGEISIPKSTPTRTVTLTLYDGSRRRAENTNVLQLHHWIEAWGNELVNISGGVKTLFEACRPLKIVHYDARDSTILERTFAVYPNGSIEFTGDSDAGINQLQVEFIIAGIVGSSNDSILPAINTR